MHSDSLLHFPTSPVPITLPFRLSLPFSYEPCPNHPPIRTLSFIFLRALSQSPSYSDSLFLFPTNPVPITLPFGLSPSFSYEPCPNHPPIQTLSSFFLRALSQSPSHSDLHRYYLASPVQTSLSHQPFSKLTTQSTY